MGKHYWHVWYLVDYDGQLLATSEAFKLDGSVGIEFAAGLAHDPDTGELVVSYGIEDDSAWLGVTTLDAVLAMLSPVSPIAEIATTVKTTTGPGKIQLTTGRVRP
jgi:hypothetical protein